MKFIAGKVLNDTLYYAIQIANEVFNHKNGRIDKFVIQQVCSARLDLLYQNFLMELKTNITDYNKTDYIIEYLDICFESFLKWKGFGADMSDRIIIRNQHEVRLLLNLKKSIETYHLYIHKWYKIDYKYNGIKISLLERYERTLVELKAEDTCDEQELLWNRRNNSDIQFNIDEVYPDDRTFNYDTVKEECEKQPTTLQKIECINQHLIEFKHWKLKCDEDEIKTGRTASYTVRNLYSPNFEKHCDIEIEGLKTKLELEKELNYLINGPAPVYKTPAQYTWNASDTDLLELSTALLKTNTITRKDGKKMTQKELREAFEAMLGMEIKSAKAKLSNAVQRKKISAPFLERLKTAFEKYTKERA